MERLGISLAKESLSKLQDADGGDLRKSTDIEEIDAVNDDAFVEAGMVENVVLEFMHSAQEQLVFPAFRKDRFALMYGLFLLDELIELESSLDCSGRLMALTKAFKSFVLSLVNEDGVMISERLVNGEGNGGLMLFMLQQQDKRSCETVEELVGLFNMEQIKLVHRYNRWLLHSTLQDCKKCGCNECSAFCLKIE